MALHGKVEAQVELKSAADKFYNIYGRKKPIRFPPSPPTIFRALICMKGTGELMELSNPGRTPSVITATTWLLRTNPRTLKDFEHTLCVRDRNDAIPSIFGRTERIVINILTIVIRHPTFLIYPVRCNDGWLVQMGKPRSSKRQWSTMIRTCPSHFMDMKVMHSNATKFSSRAVSSFQRTKDALQSLQWSTKSWSGCSYLEVFISVVKDIEPRASEAWPHEWINKSAPPSYIHVLYGNKSPELMSLLWPECRYILCPPTDVRAPSIWNKHEHVVIPMFLQNSLLYRLLLTSITENARLTISSKLLDDALIRKILLFNRLVFQNKWSDRMFIHLIRFCFVQTWLHIYDLRSCLKVLTSCWNWQNLS